MVWGIIYFQISCSFYLQKNLHIKLNKFEYYLIDTLINKNKLNEKFNINFNQRIFSSHNI